MDKKLLKQIDEFENYLLSDTWKILKKERHTKDGDMCVLCKDTKALICHHLYYGRLYKEDINDLISLCLRCHSRIHQISPPSFIPLFCQEVGKQEAFIGNITIKDLQKELIKISFR